MKAILLGSGTSVPSPRRGAPGLLLESDQSALLIDPGPGSVTRLAQVGLEPTAITAVLVTHLHPDHVNDLVPLLFCLRNPRYGEEPSWPRLIGPPGFAGFYRRLRAPFEEWIPAAGEGVEPEEWRGEGIVAGDCLLDAKPVRHLGSSLAWRITDEWGGVVAFSGDTEECAGIAAVAEQAGLLFLECSAPGGTRIPGHLDPGGVSRIVRKAQVRRCVLVHLNPECDEVDLLGQIDRDVRPRVEVGEDLREYSS
ncbi:MAG: MBL fold metallo-hydrolase [Planctomycetota bacterium]